MGRVAFDRFATLLLPCALVALASMAVPSPAAGSAPTADVRMAPATPGSVRFTVAVPAPQLEATGDADGTVAMKLDGYEQRGEPGTPALPWRIVVVAVPPLGDVRVHAVASELVTHDAVTLAPVPGSDGKGNARAARNAVAYGTAGSAVPVAARLLQVTWMRNQRIARIAIEPVAYEPASRRLTAAGRVDVDVQVQPLGAIGSPAEPDDPFEDAYRGVLANYDQGRQWRRPGTAALLSTAKRLGLRPDRALATQPPTTGVLYGHSWVKIAVRQTGFYAVNFSTLRTTALFGNHGAPFDSLRLFALGGYPQLPESTYCDSCDMSEVAIGTYDTSDPAGASQGQPDGQFSYNTDYFYFFAQGPSGWSNEYDPSLPDTSYIDHPYDLNSYYYLTLSSAGSAAVPGAPKRMVTRTDVLPVNGAPVVQSFPDRQHFEQDKAYWPNATAIGTTLAWEKWFWSSMAAGDVFNFQFDLLDADTTQAARLRLRDWGLTDNATFTPSCYYRTHFDHYLDVRLNDLVVPTRHWNTYTALEGGAITIDTTAVSTAGTTFLRTVKNSLVLQVPRVNTASDCPYRVENTAFAWFEIYYQHLLRPRNDSLTFRSPDANGPYHYDIGPFPRNLPPRLFDVTRPDTPAELRVDPSMWVQGTDGWTLSFEDTGTVVKRYRVIPDSVIALVRVPRTSVNDAPETSLTDNLRAADSRADYVVIYYDGFQAAAEALAAARAQHLPISNRQPPYPTKIVPVSALYDQFSGGRTDPAAIRNFLHAALFNWSLRPKYVVFMGDASYDFKNIKNDAPPGQPGTLLPTYENGFDDFPSIKEQFSTDDWMLNVTDPTSFIPDFYGGRIPADDASTALALVNNKIMAYEQSAPLGEYRNQILLLADDDLQGENYDGIGWGHLKQTNALNLNHIPAHEDREYVYLHTYASGPGGTKPGARADVKTDLDAGVAFFNFIGHGSPFKITDESVFIDTDAASLTNGAKKFVFVAASCDVGQFDDPDLPSLGERLFMNTGGGAIAVISATGQALSSENTSLANYFYDQIYKRGDLVVGADTLYGAGKYHVPLSAALLIAKMSAPGTGPINNSKYELMGDPATLANLPRLTATMTLTDAQGQPVTSLQRGQTVSFAGQVTDGLGGAPVAWDGTASMLVEDSAPTDNTIGNPWDVGTPGHNASNAAYYRYRAGAIYHGDVTLAHGAFEGKFVVPMDATVGTVGRVRVYFTGRAATDAAASDGASALTVSVATGKADTTDTQGPQIKLSFVGGASVVRPDATLNIELFDENGIMTTAHAPQNSIIVTTDDNTTSRTDVTSSFRNVTNSYQGGVATFTLPGLAVGHHKIAVSAADNLATGITAVQHRSSASIEFDVAEQPALKIAHAYLFPNPLHVTAGGASGAFVIDAPGDSVNTMVRIYTLSGRVVRVLKNFSGLGQVQLPWDGRDAEGEPLANGVYLFKVYANSRQADGTSSARDKASAEGRIVILNR